ncbi:tRNA (adenosine(37)-N6)-threonylcarbamoyltransferase complex ATPase subunit type 1 TsaE [Neosynechococcus sphagnicola]|uniref:tRNA (adenosine(37)-N6)-threonylcarbamoyltransferase complex ATPase subunit type 1 TsaE n=1 Tax=Neosynechococcus sphagnicola TaxID=1501145 RepID=UPI0009DD64FD|nr:tRNA (adenosine(37)-N6)-threonylcarbamoyltransferase complex ATPase subunit type 1 TsaE [Neosynechococcus sphagnicola]
MSLSPLNYRIPDAAAMRSLGNQLGQTYPPGIVLLLEGTLGSGKTTLVQGIGAGLGIIDAITSPTFTLICEYLEGRLPLYHFDLYRLDPQEVGSLQPEIYWEGGEVLPGVVAIEWAERLPYRPTDYLRLCLRDDPTADRSLLNALEPSGLSGGSRQVVMAAVGAISLAWLEQFRRSGMGSAWLIQETDTPPIH